MRELENLLPIERRDEVRREILAKAPPWYDPWAHFALPSTFGLLVVRGD
jgi:hypothetical protein